MIRACFLAALCAAAVTAQSLTGILLDPSNSAVPQARITLAGGGQQWEASTGPSGEFAFQGRQAGNYELRCEIAGFDPVRLPVRVGNTPTRRLQILLKLASVKGEVSVNEGDRTVAPQADRNADAISVERTMLDNLPFVDNNYLAALGRFLDPGTPGGSGTSIIVDGMEMRNAGVTASAIQEIRINNNPYTVEYPRWSRRRVEVITKSSADAYHGTLNLLFRDYRFNARDALAATRPQEQRRIAEGSLFGPVGRSKSTSFLLSAAREEEDLVAVVFARGPRGAIFENVPTPQVNSVASLRLSHQFNDKQAMFWQYNFQDRWQNNQGIGGTVLAEAGTQARFREDEFTVNHRAIVNTKLLSQFRIMVGRYWAPIKSNQDAVRLVVTDAFTGGGAQADRLSTEFHTSITWLVTQTAGKHTMKYGINVPDWSRRGLSDRSNQIGTVSYASLADFEAARPFASVVQRGDPRTILSRRPSERSFRTNGNFALGFRSRRGCATTGRISLETPTTSLPGWRSPGRRASRERLSSEPGPGSSSTARVRGRCGTSCGSTARGFDAMSSTAGSQAGTYPHCPRASTNWMRRLSFQT